MVMQIKSESINLKDEKMLNNIKLIGVIFLSVLLLTNCKKENKDTQQPGELVFAAIDAVDTEKDGIDQFDIICNEDLVVVKARVNLNGQIFYPATFMSEGKLLTQSIKLPPGQYKILEFSLLTADDVVVKSTPMEGSDFADYVTNAIDDEYDFTIEPYVKNEYAIDVLCYLEAYTESFGFEWFEVTEITIREQCFFGDFCIKDVTQYEGSLYGLDGVTIDEKAIFKIRLKKYDEDFGEYVYYAEFSNFEDGVYSSPLCVEYADYDATDDFYQAELWIYVTSGEIHDYVYFHTWDFKDAEMIEDLYGVGDDGVVDFVLGNCVADPTDLLLPPWMNLPLGDFYDFSLSNGGFGGGNDYYWDIHISGVTSPLYDIWNDVFPGWCADEGTTINNTSYCMDARSSLYPEMLPAYWLDAVTGGLTRTEAIAAANWLWNNEGNYEYTGVEMQDALWKLFNNKNVGGKALEMATDAMDHTDYSPLPGGWAAIFFVPCESEPDQTLQMTFFVVDP